jgi:type VI secretion system secreted protein VgrG
MTGPNKVADQLAAADTAAKASSSAATSVKAVQGCGFAGIAIEGTDAFREKTQAALKEIAATPSGAAMLAALKDSGKTVTIKETSSGNACNGFTNAAVMKDGKPGTGSDSTVLFNPDRKSTGSEKWETRPPAIGLGHELVHATHAARGEVDLKKVDNDSKPDPAHPKQTAKELTEEVRTAGVPPYDKEPYSENKLRDEWKPKQPARPWY